MGTPPIITKAPSLPGSENILSPYGAGINTSIAGTVKYMPFTTSHQDIGPVSSFVQGLIGLSSFRGTRMMAVEWSGVAQRGGSSVSLQLFFDQCWYIIIAHCNWIRMLPRTSPCCTLHLQGTSFWTFISTSTYNVSVSVNHQYIPSCPDNKWDFLICRVHLPMVSYGVGWSYHWLGLLWLSLWKAFSQWIRVCQNWLWNISILHCNPLPTK